MVNRFQQYRPTQVVQQYVPTRLDANMLMGAMQERQNQYNQSFAALNEPVNFNRIQKDEQHAQDRINYYNSQMEKAASELQETGNTQAAAQEIMRLKKEYNADEAVRAMGARYNANQEYMTKFGDRAAKGELYANEEAAYYRNQIPELYNQDGGVEYGVGTPLYTPDVNVDQTIKDVAGMLRANKFVTADGSILGMHPNGDFYVTAKGTQKGINKDEAAALISNYLFANHDVQKYMGVVENFDPLIGQRLLEQAMRAGEAKAFVEQDFSYGHLGVPSDGSNKDLFSGAGDFGTGGNLTIKSPGDTVKRITEANAERANFANETAKLMASFNDTWSPYTPEELLAADPRDVKAEINDAFANGKISEQNKAILTDMVEAMAIQSLEADRDNQVLGDIYQKNNVSFTKMQEETPNATKAGDANAQQAAFIRFLNNPEEAEAAIDREKMDNIYISGHQGQKPENYIQNQGLASIARYALQNREDLDDVELTDVRTNEYLVDSPANEYFTDQYLNQADAAIITQNGRESLTGAGGIYEQVAVALDDAGLSDVKLSGTPRFVELKDTPGGGFTGDVIFDYTYTDDNGTTVKGTYPVTGTIPSSEDEYTGYMYRRMSNPQMTYDQYKDIKLPVMAFEIGKEWDNAVDFMESDSGKRPVLDQQSKETWGYVEKVGEGVYKIYDNEGNALAVDDQGRTVLADSTNNKAYFRNELDAKEAFGGYIHHALLPEHPIYNR